METKQRCAWAGTDPLYMNYHDTEWGVPQYTPKKLFEFLILEGAQAGLSWITVLKKRDNYRLAFDGFNPEKMALYDAAKIESLLLDKGIIRNRLKIEAAIRNAKAYLALQKLPGGFDGFLWRFVGDKPIKNAWNSPDKIPVRTEISVEMSKALKQRGFRFVGPTICYAFMQAVGMVNDHVVDCFRYAKV